MGSRSPESGSGGGIELRGGIELSHLLIFFSGDNRNQRLPNGTRLRNDARDFLNGYDSGEGWGFSFKLNPKFNFLSASRAFLHAYLCCFFAGSSDFSFFQGLGSRKQ
jgi:hypothetical protein